MADEKLKALQARWYELKAAWEAEGMPDASPKQREFHHHDAILCKYIWDTAAEMVAEDRRKHPKAKRNQIGTELSGGNRYLP